MLVFPAVRIVEDDIDLGVLFQKLLVDGVHLHVDLVAKRVSAEGWPCGAEDVVLPDGLGHDEAREGAQAKESEKEGCDEWT